MLDVLDQHQPTARTVASLAASVLSTHVDPAYQMEGLWLTRLRRGALISAAVVVPIALIALYIQVATWKDGHWHIGLGGVTAMAYSPADRHILVTATSGNLDGLDTLWNVTDPARPRRLADTEGGAPATFAPDGRTVATVAFSGQPALWNVTDLSKPARITTLPSGDDGKLWGEAFSPDGRILAAAYTDRLDLWNVTDLARPRLVRTLAAPVAPPWRALFNQGDIAFSPDGRLLASTAGRDQLPDTHWHAGPRNQPAAPASPVSRACSFRQSRLPDRGHPDPAAQRPNRPQRNAAPRRAAKCRPGNRPTQTLTAHTKPAHSTWPRRATSAAPRAALTRAGRRR